MLNCGNPPFADDLTLYVTIQIYNGCLKLQMQINTAEAWCTDNKLLMNVSKCKLCSFTRKVDQISYDYTFNSVIY